MKDQINPEPVRLTTSGYWTQIQELVEKSKIPKSLGQMLASLINCHNKKLIPPKATTELIWEAKQYLSDGILISDSSSDHLYDVMILVPDVTIANPRLSFQLIPKWEHAELKSLNDF